MGAETPPDNMTTTQMTAVMMAGTGQLSRDDVERAIWALTGWRGEQSMVDELLAVIDRYAWGCAGGAPATLDPRQAHLAHLLVDDDDSDDSDGEVQGAAGAPGTGEDSPSTLENPPTPQAIPPTLEQFSSDDAGLPGEPVLAPGEVGIVCKGCGVEKPDEAFSVDRSTRTGRRGKCKACDARQRREARKRLADEKLALRAAGRADTGPVMARRR